MAANVSRLATRRATTFSVLQAFLPVALEPLDLETPASCYHPSTRPYPERRVELEYPDHFEIRRVSQMGSMRWKCRWVCVSHLLGREDVGLEEIGDGVWAVYYGPVHLGWLDERDFRIMDVKGKRRRS